MFSFQPHSQMLYHLTQLTSILNSKSAPYSVKFKRQNEFKRTQDDVSPSSLSKVTKKGVDILMFDIKTNNVLMILDQLSMKSLKKNLEKSNKWEISYTPGFNFNQNKEKVFCTQFTEQIFPTMYLSSKKRHNIVCTLCVRNPFNHHAQTRGFRTKRTMSKEPGWWERLKNTKTNMMETTHSNDILKDIKSNTSINEDHRIFTEAFLVGFRAGQKDRPKVYTGIMSTIVLGSLLIILWSGVYVIGMRLSLMDGGRFKPKTTDITFNDVKGVAEAKQELLDVVEFLKNPEKFVAIGAKLPKGILLVGPPGTGKTLLARAVAGEAGVPFFQVAGPEFDELLVGHGARKMRDLFKAAREIAPSVIFIDEIDSVGAKRASSTIHPYANQTINQLLTEMDGFLQNEGVIVVGATNRRDDLDPALMRPGRFDVEVLVDLPDITSRKEIFNLYLSRISTRDVDTEFLAKCTAGFTGADIENMVNQAALNAAINDSEYVTMKHLDYARDKLIMGPERKAKINDDETNRTTAYHEAGHALVAYYTKDAPKLHKITIMPRRLSLGHTAYVLEKDQYLISKSQLLGRMDVAMGGRAAEELIFGTDSITTGASSDFKSATKIAEDMVNLYGMSEKVGFGVRLKNREKYQQGPATNDLANNEVKRLLQESYTRAKTILQEHAKELKSLADALLTYETLSFKDVIAIINDEKIPIDNFNN